MCKDTKVWRHRKMFFSVSLFLRYSVVVYLLFLPYSTQPPPMMTRYLSHCSSF